MTTIRLALPQLSAGQDQKHVTVNEGFSYLDTLVQTSALDKDLATPPGSPTAGDTYIVASSPTGSWVGKANSLAVYSGAGWVFFTPNSGFLVFVVDEATYYSYQSSAWAPMIGNSQVTRPLTLPFGGRWACETDNRWVGHAAYPSPDKNVGLGTSASPNTDWTAMGDFVLLAGDILQSLRLTHASSNSEVTGFSWKVYFQYNAWDGNADTNGEVTRVEVASGTVAPAGSAIGLKEFTPSLTGYECPANGFLLLCIKPTGTITAQRQVHISGQLNVYRPI